LLEIAINSLKINHLNYYNKLVLKKNLLPKNKKNLQSYVLLKKQKKKKNSNVVTLRAPKHFKVGRHHYNVITQQSTIFFKFLLKTNKIFSFSLYKYMFIIMNLIKKKKLAKTLSLTTQIKLTIKIIEVFKITF